MDKTSKREINREGNVGDAITLDDPGTGRLTVAPNLAYRLMKDSTDMYTVRGRVFVKDAFGNATQISPHDENGNWIFYSEDKQGHTTKINMIDAIQTIEKLTERVAELENKLGLNSESPKKLIYKN